MCALIKSLLQLRAVGLFAYFYKTAPLSVEPVGFEMKTAPTTKKLP